MAGSQLGFHLVMSLQPAHAMSDHMATSTLTGGRMVAAHITATAVAALLLARGETLIWALAALLAPVLRLVLLGGTGAQWLRPWRPSGRQVLPLRVTGLVEVGLRHRGPPASLAV